MTDRAVMSILPGITVDEIGELQEQYMRLAGTRAGIGSDSAQQLSEMGRAGSGDPSTVDQLALSLPARALVVRRGFVLGRGMSVWFSPNRL